MFLPVRGSDRRKGSAGNVPDVPAANTGEVLAETFGGHWVRWEAGPAGVPGGTMWARLGDSPEGRPVITGLVITGDVLTAESLRRVPVRIIEQAMAESRAGTEEQMRAELEALPPLERGDLPAAAFSQLVADHYRIWARYVSRPAAGMAERWGVKSATMHGWIREARLRGLLPEAERGKRARG